MNGVNYLEPSTAALWQARAALMDQVQKIDRAISALGLSPKETLAPVEASPAPAPARTSVIRSSGEWVKRDLPNLPSRFTIDEVEARVKQLDGLVIDRTYMRVILKNLCDAGELHIVKPGGRRVPAIYGKGTSPTGGERQRDRETFPGGGGDTAGARGDQG